MSYRMTEYSCARTMDPIWTHLPTELAEHVCNQLPKVRRMSNSLKTDLVFWPLERLLKYNAQWFGRRDGYDILIDDFNMLNETDFVDVYDAWVDMDVDVRLDYYYSVMR